MYPTSWKGTLIFEEEISQKEKKKLGETIAHILSDGELTLEEDSDLWKSLSRGSVTQFIYTNSFTASEILIQLKVKISTPPIRSKWINKGDNSVFEITYEIQINDSMPHTIEKEIRDKLYTREIDLDKRIPGTIADSIINSSDSSFEIQDEITDIDMFD